MMRLVASVIPVRRSRNQSSAKDAYEHGSRASFGEGKMADLAMIPETCPICRSGSLKQIMRETFLSVHIDGLACPSTGAVAYHCDNGHVFLVVNDDFGWKEAVREGNGHTIFV